MASSATAASALSATSLAPLPEWVDFSLGEDVRNDRREEQDRQWAKAISDGRVHLSHREFALLYGPRFQSAIEDFHMVYLLVRGMYSTTSPLRRLNELVLTMIIEYAYPGQAALVPAIVNQCEVEHRLASPICQDLQAQRQDFLVCLRKRPLLWQEIKVGAYDVTSIPSSSQWMDTYHQYIHSDQTHAHLSTDDKKNLKKQYPQSLRLHEGKLARNGRLLSMTHHHVLFDRVYDDTVQTKEICDDVIDPLVNRLFRGQASSLLCFGQTGTGKTYTLDGALHYIAQRLVGHQVRVWFYEVHGKKCYDLLQNRSDVTLRFDKDEIVHACGAHVAMFSSVTHADVLHNLFNKAMSLRSSLVTERNPISSRSHAVCIIEVLSPISNEDNGRLGRMTLVDLAGSERNYETQSMSGAMHKESAEINLALMSLKNCFRAYHQQRFRIPYRESTLTKVLKPCFFPLGMQKKKQQQVLASTVNSSPNNSVTASPTKAQVKSAFTNPLPPSPPLSGGKASSQSLASYLAQQKSMEASNETEDMKKSVDITNHLVFPPAVAFPSVKQSDDNQKTLTLNDRHFTVIIATISPSPIDIQHSLNTINHVLLMTRVPLYVDVTSKMIPLPQATSVTVEVPKTSFAALSSVPMHAWTEEQVISWLATVERGKFAHFVLPRGTTGKDLTRLSVQTIAQLFEQSEKFGRREDAGEGPVWVITADLDTTLDENGNVIEINNENNDNTNNNNNNNNAIPTVNRKFQAISLALYNAVRREANAYHRQQTLMQQMSSKPI